MAGSVYTIEVVNRKKRLGRKPGLRVRWRPDKRKVVPAVVLGLRRQGVSVTALAAKFKCTRPTIYAAIREAEKASTPSKRNRRAS